MLALHKFIVAISRIEVNHDGSGGTALFLNLEPPLSGLLWITPHSQVPPIFWTALGVACLPFHHHSGQCRYVALTV